MKNWLRGGLLMATRKTIYLVTSGTYSDYSIEGAFSSKRKASAFVRSKRGISRSTGESYNDYRIEEFQLDAVRPSALTLYEVSMSLEDGSNASADPDTYNFFDDEERRKGGWTYPQYQDEVPRFAVLVQAKTPEAAIKIANEKRLVYKANEVVDRSQFGA